MLEIGKSYTIEQVVTPEMTARAIGSGGLEVFGTPFMMAMMEHAAMDCVQPDLPEGKGTVGVDIQSSHLAPTLMPTGSRAELWRSHGFTCLFVLQDASTSNRAEGSNASFIVPHHNHSPLPRKAEISCSTLLHKRLMALPHIRAYACALDLPLSPLECYFLFQPVSEPCSTADEGSHQKICYG